MRLGTPPLPCPRCRASWWSRRFYMDAKVAAWAFGATHLAFYGSSMARMWATDTQDVARSRLWVAVADVSRRASAVLLVASLVVVVVGWVLGLLARRPGPVSTNLASAYRDEYPRADCPLHPPA